MKARRLRIDTCKRYYAYVPTARGRDAVENNPIGRRFDSGFFAATLSTRVTKRSWAKRYSGAGQRPILF